MERNRTGARSWIGQLWADARQGVVGGVAWVIVVAVALALVGLLAGDVPAWTLPIAFLAGALLPSIALVTMRRRYDVQSGRVEELRSRVEDTERRVGVVEADRDDARRRLLQAGAGETPMSERAQGYVRQIRALRASAESQMNDPVIRTWATGAEQSHLIVVIDELKGVIGENRTLKIAYNHWTDTHEDADMTHIAFLTTLGQLEALVTGWGVEDALRPKPGAA